LKSGDPNAIMEAVAKPLLGKPITQQRKTMKKKPVRKNNTSAPLHPKKKNGTEVYRQLAN